MANMSSHEKKGLYILMEQNQVCCAIFTKPSMPCRPGRYVDNRQSSTDTMISPVHMSPQTELLEFYIAVPSPFLTFMNATSDVQHSIASKIAIEAAHNIVRRQARYIELSRTLSTQHILYRTLVELWQYHAVLAL